MAIKKRRDKRKNGLTLVELIVVIAILVSLASFIFGMNRQVSQRSKTWVAKCAITQTAMMLEMIKDSNNFYPPSITEILAGKAFSTLKALTFSMAPEGHEHNWRGPYFDTSFIIDPWGTPYFYHVIYEEGIIFGPTQCFRSTPPKYQDFSFIASPGGAAKIILDNFDLTACSVILNGVEIVTEDEFKMATPRMEKAITLLPGNNVLSVRARSNKSAYVLIGITSPLLFGNHTGYILGSYGADAKIGGDGFNQDIIWTSGQSSPGFN